MLEKYNASGYFSGHDHCLELIDEGKGPKYILTGAGDNCCYPNSNVDKNPKGKGLPVQDQRQAKAPGMMDRSRFLVLLFIHTRLHQVCNLGRRQGLTNYRWLWQLYRHCGEDGALGPSYGRVSFVRHALSDVSLYPITQTVNFHAANGTVLYTTAVYPRH